jgi:acetyltransferase-like isoleucine patch superfamily enzyme
MAFRYNKFPGLYRQICRPRGEEYAEYLRLHGGFYSMGQGCAILPTTVFLDPAYVRIGNNVSFSTCTLIGHSGDVAVMNVAYGKRLESVGKIDIRDNVFIGFDCVILPNVTIGPNAIVAAGSVVTKDVPPNSIVSGSPARVVGNVEEYVADLEQRTAALPWADIIANREGAWDPAVEAELVRQRVKYFYGSDSAEAPKAEAS